MDIGAIKLLRSLPARTLDFIFPPHCIACGASGAFLCSSCLEPLRALPPRCPICWMPADFDAPCLRCLRVRPAFAAARSSFVYRDSARQAVHALKYGNLPGIAAQMASPMAELFAEWNPDVGLIVPVPLTGSRKRSRGYNQSELLAREIAWRTGLPLSTRLLVRKRKAPPQARSSDEEARRRNVDNAFLARPEHAVHGGVLLIDDVLTSGATLDACAQALTSAGDGPVFALTFARD